MTARERGLTLVEVTVTVAIIALMVGMVLPAIGNVSRADLRKGTSVLASKIREGYDNAALTGNTWRLVFVMRDAQTPKGSFKAKKPILDEDHKDKKERPPGVYMESTERTMVFDSKSGAFAAAADAQEILDALDPAPGEDPNEKERDKHVNDDLSFAGGAMSAGGAGALGALFGINKLAKKEVAKGEEFKDEGRIDLGDNVHVLDVWTEGMDLPSSDGDSYLLFFPNGYTQDAIIHLEDTERRVMSVRVSPLTGKCRIDSGYVEPPK